MVGQCHRQRQVPQHEPTSSTWTCQPSLHPTAPRPAALPAVATENPPDCNSLCYFSKILPHLPLPLIKRQNARLGVQGAPKFDSGLRVRAGLSGPVALWPCHTRTAPPEGTHFTPRAVLAPPPGTQLHSALRLGVLQPAGSHSSHPEPSAGGPPPPAHSLGWFSRPHRLLAGTVFTYSCLCFPWCSAHRGCFQTFVNE